MNKKNFENNLKSLEDNFGKNGKIYFCTNENLKEYIPDLSNKKVLTVSASGDHLLNCAVNGTTHIDTFDINNYSPLFQTLKICAIEYLSIDDALMFIDTLDYNLYLKFNDFLPVQVRKFFDFLYHTYPNYQFMNLLFYPRDVDIKNVNSYFNSKNIQQLKSILPKLTNNHFSTNLYNLSYFLDDSYDCMFLSNISQYCNPDAFINYLNYLAEFYLNKDGEIYFAYIYNNQDIHTSLDGLKHISDKFASYRDLKNFSKKIDVRVIDSAEYHNSKDAVLVLHK